MKKKNISLKKLLLGKGTIAQLTEQQQGHLLGGGTVGLPCRTVVGGSVCNSYCQSSCP